MPRKYRPRTPEQKRKQLWRNNAYFVDPMELQKELLAISGKPDYVMTPKLGSMVLNMITGIMARQNYNGYYGEYVELMRFRALEACLTKLWRYDEEVGQAARDQKIKDGWTSLKNKPKYTIAYSFVFFVIFRACGNAVIEMKRIEKKQNTIFEKNTVIEESTELSDLGDGSVHSKKEELIDAFSVKGKNPGIDDLSDINTGWAFEQILEHGIPATLRKEIKEYSSALKKTFEDTAPRTKEGRIFRRNQTRFNNLDIEAASESMLLEEADPLHVLNSIRAARARDAELAMVNSVVEEYLATHEDSEKTRAKIKRFLEKYKD